MWSLTRVLACLALSSGVNAFHTSIFSPHGVQHSSCTILHSSNLLQEPAFDRRSALIAGATTLLPLLLGEKAVASEPQTILITGSNSGIGFEATKLLAKKGHTVILGCRTLQKAEDAVARIREDTSTGNLFPAECNLASLDSIRSFAANLKYSNLDVVCLNAGLALDAKGTIAERTEDGFELTVGINHLGHFYLNHLLLPKVSPKGRIVVTASSVHDPDSPGGAQGIPATLGDLAGFERDGRAFEMVDGTPYNGDKAYKDSKLCNVFFTRELQRRLASNASTSGITVNCFSPGLITSSGFFRYQNPFFAKAFGVIAEKVARVAETPEWGGGCLAYMVNVDTRGQFWNSSPGSSKFGDAAYGREFSPKEISKEAKDDAKARKLWKLSEELVGIKA